MAAIQAGRFTHQHDGDLVVFLIGMRVNRWRQVRAWWPTFTAMPTMLKELYADPSSGLLGHRMSVSLDGPLLVQYWASLAQLLAYAHAPDRAHRPAWQAFNAGARKAGPVVGIWHETFVVPAGGHESNYSGMPVQGLAKATASVPIGKRTETASQRLAGAS